MVVETNGRAMVRHQPTESMALASWNAEQVDVIKKLICPGASDAELGLFAQVCKQTGLSPFAKQIYGLMRWDGRAQREVLSIQTSIDGFRLVAQRSGEYAGQIGPEWCGEDGIWREVWLSKEPPAAARVGVLRKGLTVATYGIATWAEYCQRKANGDPTGMWVKMPATMLAKCAEALALRKVFPAELSGLYSSEEMAQADNPPPTIVETVAAVEPPAWVTTFEQQWAKGEAAAHEIGATVPPKLRGNKAEATATLKTLAQNIALKRESLALGDALSDEYPNLTAQLLKDPDRVALIADLRSLIERARTHGATFDLPADLSTLADADIEVLHESILNALEAHIATAAAAADDDDGGFA